MARVNSLKNYMDIFLTSAKVGALTFGGGYAMMPILQREVVEKKHWNTEAEILDYFALSQCMPGIIMVNTQTFIGNKRAGRRGAVAAALGAVTPSVLIILVIAAVLTNFADNPFVQDAFAGIRVCVCVLILNAILKLWKDSVIDIICLALFLCVAVGSLFTNLSPILFILVSAIIGIIVSTKTQYGKGSDGI